MSDQEFATVTTLTKTRFAALCALFALAAAVPVGYLWRSNRDLREENTPSRAERGDGLERIGSDQTPLVPIPPTDRVEGREFPTAEGTTLAIPLPDAKATVLVFTSTTCPIANGFAPELQRIDKEFAPTGIQLVLVETEIDVTAASAREHGEEFGFTCPIVLDPGRSLTHAAGATMTPEAAVLSPDGEILYRGRIDDRFPAVGQRRAAPRQTELRDALAALLAGEPVPVPRTEAVGCFIE